MTFMAEYVERSAATDEGKIVDTNEPYKAIHYII